MAGSHCTLLLVTVLLIIIEFATSQLSSSKEDLLNWCLNGKNHKGKPGKEDSLHSQCTPWKDHACCTEEVTHAIHHTDMYNFTLDHCKEQTGHGMSEGCRKHFIQDNCFYECEPSIGLWVVQINRTVGKERFYKVPLCPSDCDSWFEDCKDDYTCVHNWPREFKFKKGRNFCPNDSTCRTFKEMYQTSKDFCEKVWDHSWEYAPHLRPCMKIWFNGSNPNVETAEIYYKEKFEGGAATVSNAFSILAHLILAVFLVFYF